jgi:hypothetical protein
MAIDRESDRLGYNFLANRLEARPLIKDLPPSPISGSTVYLEDPRILFAQGQITKRQKAHLPSEKSIRIYEKIHGVHVVYNGPYKPDNYYRYLDHRPIPKIMPQESWEEREERLSKLPTPETTDPGYSGPYRPPTYEHETREQSIITDSNVIFDKRLLGE